MYEIEFLTDFMGFKQIGRYIIMILTPNLAMFKKFKMAAIIEVIETTYFFNYTL